MTTGRPGEINVTPMIDVLLVLIIIFMLIVPERSQGLPAQAPPQSSQETDGRPVIVHVAEDRSLTINTEPVAWDSLDSRLRRIFSTRADRVLFVAADRQSEFADVAHVVDTARGAGIDRIALVPRHR